MPRPRRIIITRQSTAFGSNVNRELLRCVVCYQRFHQFSSGAPKWESSLSKVFYKALNIPPIQTGVEDDEEEDTILSLPYCPECHSKISVMYSLYSQLENIQNQYATLRNEIAFVVVESMDKRCKNGPMDFIRRQIYERWKEYHMEESSKEDYRDSIGLDALVNGNTVVMSEINFEEEELEGIKLEDINFNQFDQATVSPKQIKGAKPEGTGEISSEALQEEDSWTDIPAGEESFQDEPLVTPKKLDSKYGRAGAFQDQLSPDIISRASLVEKSSEAVASPGQSSIGSGRARTRGGINRRGRPLGSRGTRMQRFYASVADLDPGAASDISSLNSPTRKRGRGITRRGGVERSRQSLRNLRSPKQPTLPKDNDVTDLKEPDEVSVADSKPGDDDTEADAPDALDGLHKCSLCTKAFQTESRLMGHISTVHPTMRALRCPTCGKGFSSNVTYRRHVKKAHPEVALPVAKRSFQCKICNKKFGKKALLLLHKAQHQKDRKVTVIKKNAKNTKKATKSNGVEDVDLPMEFENGDEAGTSDLSNGSENYKFVCDYCEKRFQYLPLLNMHIITHVKQTKTETSQSPNDDISACTDMSPSGRNPMNGESDSNVPDSVEEMTEDEST